MSLEAVSARAGVTKTMIYRRWSSKEALVRDALKELYVEVPLVDTGNFRSDMVTLLRETVRLHLQPENPLLENCTLGLPGKLKRILSSSAFYTVNLGAQASSSSRISSSEHRPAGNSAKTLMPSL